MVFITLTVTRSLIVTRYGHKFSGRYPSLSAGEHWHIYLLVFFSRSMFFMFKDLYDFKQFLPDSLYTNSSIIYPTTYCQWFHTPMLSNLCSLSVLFACEQGIMRRL